MMVSDTERVAVDRAARRLSVRFPGVDPAPVRPLVATEVREVRRRFDGHPTRELVPILVQDAAPDRLTCHPGTRRPLTGTADTGTVPSPGRRHGP